MRYSFFDRYLYKYVYKGCDRTVVRVGEDQPVNEIREYLDSRYVGSVEAAWRIFGFELCAQSPTVIPLAVSCML